MFKNLFGKSDHELAFNSIIELLNISAFKEKKRYIHDHPILLSNDAKFILDKMIAHDLEKHNKDSAEFLKHHQHLLSRCQQIGIDQAFKELELMLLQNSLRELVDAESADQAKHVILENPELLSDAAIELLDTLIENQSTEKGRKILAHRKELLKNCKKLGIERAFQKDQEEDVDTKFMEVMAKFTSSMFGAETFLEKKLALLENPDFLSDHFLEGLESVLEDDNDELNEKIGEAYEIYISQLSPYLDLLKMCKQQGVKKTFDMMEVANIRNNYGNIVLEIMEELDFKSTSNLPYTISRSYEALKYLTKQDTPSTWGIFKNGLATALAQYPLGNRAENLEESIRHYLHALEVITIEQEPLIWGEIVQNLANTYKRRIKGDTAENIELAIKYYQQALIVFTKKDYPKDWAMTLRNLASTYSDRKYGNPIENIETTIQYCEQISEISILEDSLEDWVLNQNTLGLAYFYREIGDRSDNIERSIKYFEEILDNLSLEDLPELWGTVQHNLANSYSQRIIGNKSENIEKAIYHYEQALIIRTKEKFPEKWAMTNHDLATTYLDWIAGSPKANRRKAAKHLSLTLEINTPEQYPIECRETAVKVGNLAFEDKDWDLTIEAYEQAISAHKIVLQNLLSDKRKGDEIKELSNIHQNLAYAYVRKDDIEKAVEVLELGRATLLREAIERQRNDLGRLSELGFADLYIEYQESTALYEKLLEQKNTDADTLDLISQIEQALKRRNLAAERIRSKAGAKHPEFRYFLSSITIEDIKQKAKLSPIVYVCSTLHGGFAVVVKNKSISKIELPGLNDKSLRKSISQYFQNYQEGSAWFDSLHKTLEWLGEFVMGPILEKAKKQERLILIPGGFLGLLPLHSAIISRTKNKVKYALEQCQITFAPNAQSLNSQEKNTQKSCNSILAVDNPDKTLLFSGYEAHSAAKHFRNSNHLIHGKAKKNTVLNSMKDACVIHLSTHGEAGWMEADQSKLLLADKDLYLSELTTMELRDTKLVILSACETGIPGAELPNEVLSFPSAFIQSGVSGVIGSLWAVNDMSTAILISKFYDLWKREGMEISEALRQAQIWLQASKSKDLLNFIRKEWSDFEKKVASKEADLLIQSLTLQDPEICLFENPFYWAGFTYNGT